MPTEHRRIGVTKDPVLAAALEATRSILGPEETRSEAGHVRRLALLGARTLTAGDERAMRARQKLLAISGVRPGTGRLEDLPWLDEAVDEGRELSRALEWARGER